MYFDNNMNIKENAQICTKIFNLETFKLINIILDVFQIKYVELKTIDKSVIFHVIS